MSVLALISTFLVLHFNVIEDNAALSGFVAFVIVVVFAAIVQYGAPKESKKYYDEY